MGLFNRKPPEPTGYRPSEADVRAAAAKLTAGSQDAAYDVTVHSADPQETAMRILGHCIEDA